MPNAWVIIDQSRAFLYPVGEATLRYALINKLNHAILLTNWDLWRLRPSLPSWLICITCPTSYLFKVSRFIRNWVSKPTASLHTMFRSCVVGALTSQRDSEPLIYHASSCLYKRPVNAFPKWRPKSPWMRPHPLKTTTHPLLLAGC
jgi:hypothetical protein